jgi:membrane fusion protein (multidrug efflux system)
VDIDVGTPQHYVTLPKTAIYYNSYGDIAYVVKAGNAEKSGGGDAEKNYIAQQVFVKTGDSRGDQVAVLRGIEPGDVVVSAGQNKLHNGSPVRIDNDVKVPFSANPQVSEE